jgi:hypothetical protein
MQTERNSLSKPGADDSTRPRVIGPGEHIWSLRAPRSGTGRDPVHAVGPKAATQWICSAPLVRPLPARAGGQHRPHT